MQTDMNDTNEKVAHDETNDTATAREAGTASEIPSRGRSATPFIVVSAAILLIAGVALVWFLRSRTSSAGRPVPAPSNTTLNQPGSSESATAAKETTITLAPDVAQRAGLKIETVGEQIVSDGSGASGALATGIIQANAYRTTPVVSLVGGIVRRVDVELGKEVKRGQTIAVVFSEELATAQSRYLTALAQLEEHHKHHRREAQLVEIGAASREEFEQATTQLRTAESEVAAQRQKLLLLGLTPQRIDQLSTSSQISSEVNLPSPASGTVVSRSANPGEVIAADKEIARVADLSSVWVIGQVYEKDLGRVRVGSGATITNDAYPGRVFRGRIAYVDPSLDQATRTAQVRIELANPGQALKIGMYVSVAFAALAGAPATTPVVPKDAVQNINNQPVVFVATEDPNGFVLRPVRLGPESNGRYPVLEGLSIGERIVTEGSFLLRAEWVKMNPATHSH
jgi:cobalt-zinc-cadmium efflux system membrane fusion protein